jgi:hypothetical protein
VKRAPKLILLILLASLLVIQFFQPERITPSAEDLQGDMLLQLDAPEQVATLLTSSCYDCHSNQPSYPWYSRVAPVSFYLDKHIRKGLDEVNFSEFASEKKLKQMGILHNICEVLEEGSMPLQSYLLMHADARLSQEDIALLCDWSSAQAEALLKK